MGERWYAARTQPGLAKLAERELNRPYGDREAMRTLLPLFMDQPVFGPYIFIEFDFELDRWQAVNGVRGIMKLLPTFAATPSPLPGDFIDDLRERVSIGSFGFEEAAELVYDYSPKEVAMVTSGAWEGHRGEFVRKQKGFINLSLVLFNRPFEVPIPSHQVRPISRKAA